MLLVNNYNPYLMNTEILNYYKYLASSIQLSWNVTCEQITRYLMKTEILNYCKYLKCSIQHAWNITIKQLQPIPDEYRSLELL